MPTGIRIVCKMLEIFARMKFPDISVNEVYNIIGDFLFDLYMLPQFLFPHHYKVLKLINEEHFKNLVEV